MAATIINETADSLTLQVVIKFNRSMLEAENAREQREKVRINKKALQVADNLFPPMPSIQHSDSNLTRQPHH
jgi:hypothetical protein